MVEKILILGIVDRNPPPSFGTNIDDDYDDDAKVSNQ